jgi:heme A synthase
VTSGLAGVLVIALLIWAFRAYAKGHPVRKSSVFSLIFILTEGAVGAGLVLLELVADNDSIARAYWMAAHLANTFILIGALTLTAWWATTLAPDFQGPVLRLRRHRREVWLLAVALLLIMIVSAAGAVTALGDTLFPAGSLAEGVARDFSPTAHFLERLRIWHPLLAILSSLYIFAVLGLIGQAQGGGNVPRFIRLVQLLVAGQIAAGFVNLLLLAPVWMQLVHLFLADSVWISLVLLGAEVVAETVPDSAAEGVPRTQPAASGSAD